MGKGSEHRARREAAEKDLREAVARYIEYYEGSVEMYLMIRWIAATAAREGFRVYKDRVAAWEADPAAASGVPLSIQRDVIKEVARYDRLASALEIGVFDVVLRGAKRGITALAAEHGIRWP